MDSPMLNYRRVDIQLPLHYRLDGSDSTKMLSEIRAAIQDLDRLKSEVIMISWVKRLNPHLARWCPPSYKLVYNPINCRYITYKP